MTDRDCAPGCQLPRRLGRWSASLTTRAPGRAMAPEVRESPQSCQARRSTEDRGRLWAVCVAGLRPRPTKVGKLTVGLQMAQPTGQRRGTRFGVVEVVGFADGCLRGNF